MVRKAHYRTTATKKDSMQFVVGVKPVLVWLATMKCGVARAIRGSDLAQEGALKIQTREVRRPVILGTHLLSFRKKI